jgi:hypothetical protein
MQNVQYLVYVWVSKCKKSLTWAGGLQCKAVNIPLLWSYTENQLPHFSQSLDAPPPPTHHLKPCDTILTSRRRHLLHVGKTANFFHRADREFRDFTEQTGKSRNKQLQLSISNRKRHVTFSYFLYRFIPSLHVQSLCWKI